MIKRREATPTDAIALSKILRRADKEEIRAFSKLPVQKELLRPFRVKREGQIWAVLSDEECLLGIYGVSTKSTPHENVGVPWMLATERMFTQHKFSVMRVARTWLDELGAGYDRLENHVYAKNLVHIHWIKAMGFELVELVPNFGAKRLPFWRFEMVKKPRSNLVQAIKAANAKQPL